MFDGVTKNYGFYVTRDVEADSPEDAERKAVELLRNEEDLTSITLNARDNSPRLFVEKITLLPRDEQNLINSGFSFYPEEDGVA
jgi:hypothetical protein